MTSFTWPPEILRHRSPINWSAWCHGEPSGASVPILTTVCAGAVVRQPNTSKLTIHRDISLLPCRRSGGFKEQVIDPAQQPACAALRQQVGEPGFGMLARVDGKRPIEQCLKLGSVLRRYGRVFGAGNKQAGAPLAGKPQRLVEVACDPRLAFGGLHADAAGFDVDQELRQCAFIS